MRIKKNNNIRFITLKSINDFEIIYGENVINVFPMHIHQRFCIGAIVKGNAQFEVNHQTLLLNSGSIYFVNPGEAHQIKPLDKDGFDHIVFSFGLQFCKNYFNIFESEIPNFHFNKTIAYNSEMSTIFLNFLKLVSKNKVTDEAEFTLMEILTWFAPFISFIESDFEEKTQSENISKTCEYIINNSKKKLTLDELASNAHLSKFHFSRVFKNEVGISPYDYQIQARIKLAKGMLLNKKSIADIALELGFTDQSHFSRFFKRDIGVTPAQFIKMNIKI